MACDIELEISAGASPGEFTTRVVDAPSGGEPSATTQLDVDGLLRDRDALEATVLASGVSGRGLSTAEEQLRRIGRQLFDVLFSGPVMGTYRASMGVAMQQGQPLRVVLRLTTPQLAALPWEALFDPESGAYICRTESLVRHVPAPYTPEPLEVVPPLRVLGLVASPRGMPALDVTAEQERLSQALARPIADGLLEVEWLAQATWEAVQEKLLSGHWHVVHFIGHGDYDVATGQGLIALVGSDGRPNLVEAGRLADLLNEAHPSPRLVVLNSCSSGEEGTGDLFSGTAAALVRSGIGAVAAMQFTVSDPAAIAFAKGFYTAIAHGHSIDDAARSGRIAILGIPHTLEWVTPVLYVRGETTELFHLAKPPPAPARAPGPSESGKPTPAAGRFPLGRRTGHLLRRTLARRPLVSILAVTGLVALTGAVILAVFRPAPVPENAVPQTVYPVIANIPVGRTLAGLAVDAGNQAVYVTNPEEGTVSVIDIRPGSPTYNQALPDPIPVGEDVENATGVAVDPDTHDVFVTYSRFGVGAVAVIAKSRVLQRFESLDNRPVAVAVGNGTVYALGPAASAEDGSNGRLAVITRSSAPETTPTPPTDKSLPQGYPTVYEFTDSVPVGDTPVGVAVDLNKSTIYVTNYRSDPNTASSGTVSVIDGSNRKVTATVDVGMKPDGVAVDKNTSTVYVANFGEPSGTLSVIDGSNPAKPAVIATVDVGKNPDAVAVDPDKQVVYVTNNLPDGRVSVIDIRPGSPTYNRMIDANPATPGIDGVPVGVNPCAVAVDEYTHRVYVANCGDRNGKQGEQTVSVIEPPR